jgi:hypothetical protein
VNSKLNIFYRACANETDGVLRPERPMWFDKKKCFKSFWNEFGNKNNISIKILWDGSENHFSTFLKSFGVDFVSLDYKNNQKSLIHCYELAKGEDCDFYFFCEDDYSFLPGSCNFLEELIKYKELATLYHHPDRIIRKDDITYAREIIEATNNGYIRTGESTTQTFIVSKRIFNNLFDVFVHFCNIGTNAPADRDLFRHLITNYNIRLWHPITSYATHCVNGCLGFYVDWRKYNESIEI